MKNKIKTNELLNINETIASFYLEKYEYPWEVLNDIKNIVIEIGNNLSDEYDKLDGNIWISKTAKVDKSAYIGEYTIIDHNTEIRHNAYIRGKAIIGKNCVVGNATEIKNAILFNNVKAPHYNYIGDSVLGHNSHMGAGSIIANCKSDKSMIKLKINNDIIETNLSKFGAILGHNIEIGCNSVLNPGTIIGKDSNVYPLTSVRGYIEENSIVKKSDTIIKKTT